MALRAFVLIFMDFYDNEIHCKSNSLSEEKIFVLILVSLGVSAGNGLGVSAMRFFADSSV